MPCEPLYSGPNQISGFVCSRGRQTRGRCFYCARTHTHLCDAPLPGGGTCDRKLCGTHRQPAGAGRDLCPAHAAEAFTNPPVLFNLEVQR